MHLLWPSFIEQARKMIPPSSTDGLRAPAASLSPLFYQGARKLMLFAVGYSVFKVH